MFKNLKSGFTLIEMLVVVAVIGILSTVILTALGPARDKAKDSRIIQEVNQVRSLAEALYDGDYDALESLSQGGNLTFVNNSNLRPLAESIRAGGGDLVIQKPGGRATTFMAYSRLNTMVGVEPELRVQYYCIDSGGRSSFTTSDLGTFTTCP